MRATIARFADLTPVPWKNGGGVTREVFRRASAGTGDDFDWRASIAEIAAPGPFSSFPGIDRTLVLIDGGALELLIDGATHWLDAPGASLAFHGEARVDAAIAPGRVTMDFNIMTRRDRMTHRVDRIDAPYDWAALGTTIVTSLGCTIVLDGTEVSLAPLDCVLAEADCRIEIISGAAMRTRITEL